MGMDIPEDDNAVPMKRTCGAFLVLAIVGPVFPSRFRGRRRTRPRGRRH